MSPLLWKLGGALALGLVALTMVNYGVERLALVDAAGAGLEAPEAAPMRLTVTLFVGILALNFAVFAGIVVWSRFMRANPTTKQLPVPVLVAAIAISGALGVTGFAQHFSYMRALEPVPTDPQWGYILYATLCGVFFFAALTLVGVRWMPGAARPPASAPTLES